MSDPTVGPPAGAPPSVSNARIQGGSIRLFRVAGIDVMLHWSWFLFAALSLQGNGDGDPFGNAHYGSQIWYMVEYLALFGLVLLHEFGHVLACRSVGGVANRIVLWPLGGIAFVDPPPRPGALLWSIAAGPLVNVALLAPTIGFWLACRAAGVQDAAPDFYRFAFNLAWINGYLLLFNLLPVYPLDGGRILQALLWFVMSRARSLMTAALIGLLTGVGLVIFAIVAHSFQWGVLGGFALFFSLIGIQGARGLTRMLAAPRREDTTCPDCGTAPPIGNFWFCWNCKTAFDVFAAGGACPSCNTPLTTVLCPQCGRSRPYREWHTATPPALVDGSPESIPSPTDVGAAQPTRTARPPTVVQRVVWGLIFAAFAFVLCGLPSAEKQPLGLIIWTAGGALLGAASAGAMTKGWKYSQARRKLGGKWTLVEEDGREALNGEEQPRRLILNGVGYEERIGKQREARGVCWIDPQTEPTAISFTPKAGHNAGKPRQGVYRLEGKTLTVCLAYAGRPRPTAFVAEPEVQQVRVYRRGGALAH